MSDRQALAREVARRLGVDLESFAQHRVEEWLKSNDPLAQDQLVKTFSIGETFFLRHAHHFDLLMAEAPRLVAFNGTGALRVWSAGCSTGEEAYSIAGTLQGRLLFDLIATDLNPQSIAKARQGVYSGWSLRGREALPGWMRQEGDEVIVSPELRSHVRFEVLNLMEDTFPSGLDVIFCRNVLLYFSPERAAEVYQRFHEALAPGGLLIIADTDPPPPLGAGFQAFWRDQARAFKKPGRPEAGRARPEFPSLPPQPAPKLPDPREALSMALATPVPMKAAPSLRDQLADARGLLVAKRLDDAERILVKLVEAHPLEASPNLMLAMIAEARGRASEGILAVRRALFLDADSPFANLLMGRLLRRLGEPQRARRHLVRAKDALAHPRPDAPCAPDENEMRDMIYEQLRHL